MALNSANRDQPLRFGTPPEDLFAVAKDDIVRILGVWINASGKRGPIINHIKDEVAAICNILDKKVITDRQVALIVNSVLLPRLQYRLAVHVLSPSKLQQLTGMYMKLCKRKSRLPATTPNSIMHHNRLYAIRHLADIQAEEHISSLFLRLNDTELVGQVTRARLYQLQRRQKMTTCPTMEPQSVPYYNHNLISKICGLMADRKVTFHVEMAQDMGIDSRALMIAEWGNDSIDRE
ncbi:hypothetical protein BGZ49_005950, partial [Haplosporangium sp. Z 27]